MKNQKVKRRLSNKKLENFGDYFKSSLKTIFKKNTDAYLSAYVRVNWRKIVGKNVAQKVFFRNIVNNELFLYTKYPTWSTQILFMRDEFMAKINAFVGKNLVKSITFRKIPLDEDNKDNKKSIPSEEIKPTLKREIIYEDLTKNEKENIKNSLSKVTDEKLKAALERYAVLVKQRQNYKRDHFHKCQVCGNFYEGEYCVKCRIKERQFLELKITNLLKEEPYLSFGEVLKKIPEVTPDLLHKVRMELARQTAKKIKRSDGINADTIFFTFLVKGVSPAFLTEDAVKETLKRYRFDLASPFLKEKQDIEKY